MVCFCTTILSCSSNYCSVIIDAVMTGVWSWSRHSLIAVVVTAETHFALFSLRISLLQLSSSH